MVVMVGWDAAFLLSPKTVAKLEGREQRLKQEQEKVRSLHTRNQELGEKLREADIVSDGVWWRPYCSRWRRGILSPSHTCLEKE